jgi:hypothetical protein
MRYVVDGIKKTVLVLRCLAERGLEEPAPRPATRRRGTHNADALSLHDRPVDSRNLSLRLFSQLWFYSSDAGVERKA